MSRHARLRSRSLVLVLGLTLLSACSSGDDGPEFTLGVPSASPSPTLSCPPPPPPAPATTSAAPAAPAAPASPAAPAAASPVPPPGCPSLAPAPSASSSASPSPSPTLAAGALYPDGKVRPGQPARFVVRIQGVSAIEVSKIAQRLLGELRQSYSGYGYRPAGQPKPAPGQKDTFTLELQPEIGADLEEAAEGVVQVQELLARIGEVKAGPYYAVRLQVDTKTTRSPEVEYRFGERGLAQLPGCDWRIADESIYVCEETVLAPGQTRLTPAQIAAAVKVAAEYGFTTPGDVGVQRY